MLEKELLNMRLIQWCFIIESNADSIFVEEVVSTFIYLDEPLKPIKMATGSLSLWI